MALSMDRRFWKTSKMGSSLARFRVCLLQFESSQRKYYCVAVGSDHGRTLKETLRNQQDCGTHLNGVARFYIVLGHGDLNHFESC